MTTIMDMTRDPCIIGERFPEINLIPLLYVSVHLSSTETFSQTL